MQTTIKPDNNLKQKRTEAAVKAVAEEYGFPVLELLKPTKQSRRLSAARDTLALILLDDIGLKLETTRSLMHYVSPQSARQGKMRRIARMNTCEKSAKKLRLVREAIARV